MAKTQDTFGVTPTKPTSVLLNHSNFKSNPKRKTTNGNVEQNFPSQNKSFFCEFLK